MQKLSSPEAERVREALEYEFCEKRLNENDTPNTTGLLLNDLIAANLTIGSRFPVEPFSILKPQPLRFYRFNSVL
jgi:hypothetical protein